MLTKPFQDLNYDDVAALVQNRVSESLHLDFKRCGIGAADKDKREFLADVCAFANAEGGDLVLGIDEESGEAARITSLELVNPDAEKLRLLNIIRDGLEPRLNGTEIIWLNGIEQEGAMVVRVPKSWNGPHRVTFLKDMNFYIRNSAGKSPMNVEDLRRSFSLSASLQERARAFRTERIKLIQSDQGPVPLVEGAKFVIHTLPLAALAGVASVKFDDRTLGEVPPMQIAGGWNSVYSIDGFATFDGPDAHGAAAHSYSLVFANGMVEAVGVFGFRDPAGGELKFDLEMLEISVLASWSKHLDFLRKNMISAPFFVLGSIIEGAGYQPVTGSPYFRSYRGPRQSNFSVAEIVISDDKADEKRDVLLKPIFDRVANAFGLPSSPFYGRDGRKRGVAR